MAKQPKTLETKTLESAFEELNQIIDKMEEQDIALDESFKLYQEGMKLLKYCGDSIDNVEKEPEYT